MQKEVRINGKIRADKLERRKERWARRVTPPKSATRNHLWPRYSQYEARMGYDFDDKTESRTLRWMRQEFEDKMLKYLGNKQRVNKRSRMDKVRLKEELDFSPEVNPLLRIFGRVNDKVERVLLFEGLDALKV
jgi:hypothetical protein